MKETLEDFERLIVFLHCVQSGDGRNEKIVRLLFNWSEDEYNAILKTCLDKGYIHPPSYDILDECVLEES